MKTLPILTDIVERLTAVLPDYDVRLFPEEPSEYRLNHANGAVLIAYHGSHYGEPMDTNVAHQIRTLRIRITVISVSQHNDFGAIATLDEIRKRLLGYKPQNCNQIYLEKEEFEGQEKHLWQYGMWLYCQTNAVEHVSETNAPTFKQGIYTNNTTK